MPPRLKRKNAWSWKSSNRSIQCEESTCDKSDQLHLHIRAPAKNNSTSRLSLSPSTALLPTTRISICAAGCASETNPNPTQSCEIISCRLTTFAYISSLSYLFKNTAIKSPACLEFRDCSQVCRVLRCASNNLFVYRVPQMQGVGRRRPFALQVPDNKSDGVNAARDFILSDICTFLNFSLPCVAVLFMEARKENAWQKRGGHLRPDPVVQLRPPASNSRCPRLRRFKS